MQSKQGGVSQIKLPFEEYRHRGGSQLQYCGAALWHAIRLYKDSINLDRASCGLATAAPLLVAQVMSLIAERGLDSYPPIRAQLDELLKRHKEI